MSSSSSSSSSSSPNIFSRCFPLRFRLSPSANTSPPSPSAPSRSIAKIRKSHHHLLEAHPHRRHPLPPSPLPSSSPLHFTFPSSTHTHTSYPTTHTNTNITSTLPSITHTNANISSGTGNGAFPHTHSLHLNLKENQNILSTHIIQFGGVEDPRAILPVALGTNTGRNNDSVTPSKFLNPPPSLLLPLLLPSPPLPPLLSSPPLIDDILQHHISRLISHHRDNVLSIANQINKISREWKCDSSSSLLFPLKFQLQEEENYLNAHWKREAEIIQRRKIRQKEEEIKAKRYQERLEESEGVLVEHEISMSRHGRSDSFFTNPHGSERQMSLQEMLSSGPEDDDPIPRHTRGRSPSVRINVNPHPHPPHKTPKSLSPCPSEYTPSHSSRRKSVGEKEFSRISSMKRIEFREGKEKEKEKKEKEKEMEKEKEREKEKENKREDDKNKIRINCESLPTAYSVPFSPCSSLSLSSPSSSSFSRSPSSSFPISPLPFVIHFPLSLSIPLESNPSSEIMDQTQEKEKNDNKNDNHHNNNKSDNRENNHDNDDVSDVNPRLSRRSRYSSYLHSPPPFHSHSPSPRRAPSPLLHIQLSPHPQSQSHSDSRSCSTSGEGSPVVYPVIYYGEMEKERRKSGFSTSSRSKSKSFGAKISKLPPSGLGGKGTRGGERGEEGKGKGKEPHFQVVPSIIFQLEDQHLTIQRERGTPFTKRGKRDMENDTEDTEGKSSSSLPGTVMTIEDKSDNPHPQITLTVPVPILPPAPSLHPLSSYSSSSSSRSLSPYRSSFSRSKSKSRSSAHCVVEMSKDFPNFPMNKRGESHEQEGDEMMSEHERNVSPLHGSGEEEE